MSTPQVREAAAVVRGIYASCPNPTFLPPKTVVQHAALRARTRFSTLIRDRDYAGLGDIGVIKVYASALFEAFATQDDVRRLDTCIVLFMRGLKTPLVCKAYELWQDAAPERLRRDPYGAIFDLQGTLDDAEAAAQHFSSAKRAVQHARWLLKAARSDGHTALPLTTVVAKVRARSGADACRQLVEDEDLVEIGGFIMDAETAAADAFIATEVRKRMKVHALEFDEAEFDATLTDEQREAAKCMMTNGMCIVTGGPGTGKTTVVKALVAMVGESRCMLMAPTGRAARNMGGATVHSASGGQLLRRPIQETSKADVPDDLVMMIIDESSMLSTDLMIGVLNLAPPGCHIVLVGDANQLPPVGAGDVLRDLMGVVPTVTLSYNHRSVSGVQKLALDILEGCVGQDYGASVRMVPAALAPDAMRAVVRETSSSAAAQVLVPHNAYRHTLNRAMQSTLRPVPVQLVHSETWGIAPGERGTMRTDASGISTLSFSQTLTMPVDKAITITRPIDALLPGDTVMALKNQNKKRVRPGEASACNGDIGTLVHARPKAVVRFETGITEFPDAEPWLTLAYVATVHKFQGSECEEIVLPVHLSGAWDRQLLYTAVTRAKTRVAFVGSWDCVQSIAKRGRPKRCTALSTMILP